MLFFPPDILKATFLGFTWAEASKLGVIQDMVELLKVLFKVLKCSHAFTRACYHTIGWFMTASWINPQHTYNKIIVLFFCKKIILSIKDSNRFALKAGVEKKCTMCLHSPGTAVSFILTYLQSQESASRTVHLLHSKKIDLNVQIYDVYSMACQLLLNVLVKDLDWPSASLDFYLKRRLILAEFVEDFHLLFTFYRAAHQHVFL